jgi:hypothetical protein
VVIHRVGGVAGREILARDRRSSATCQMRWRCRRMFQEGTMDIPEYWTFSCIPQRDDAIHQNLHSRGKKLRCGRTTEVSPGTQQAARSQASVKRGDTSLKQ